MTMIEKAGIGDPPEILALVNQFAQRELMLPRSLSNIYEFLRDFFVYRQEGRIVGCGALHISWEDLGEIRSLAVADHVQGTGIARQLVESCLDEARRLGLARVFALTYVPDFFQKFGFAPYPKEKLPHKIWADCIHCPKFPDCDEVAVVIQL